MQDGTSLLQWTLSTALEETPVFNRFQEVQMSSRPTFSSYVCSRVHILEKSAFSEQAKSWVSTLTSNLISVGVLNISLSV